MIGSHRPASVRTCTLLHKAERAEVDVPIDYTGFRIADEWVVGYGLDYAERDRTLPYIGIDQAETTVKRIALHCCRVVGAGIELDLDSRMVNAVVRAQYFLQLAHDRRLHSRNGSVSTTCMVSIGLLLRQSPDMHVVDLATDGIDSFRQRFLEAA
ncbi:MAG: hypothetical protein U5K38_07480 [Woeseiaceae bacterium]|nr:hypothetical protein [Woeseiaceae bacterium]